MAPTAAEYDPTTLEASEDLVRYNRWITDAIASEVGGRTLEIGAGIGTMSANVRPLCSEMVLVEPAVNLSAALRERYRSDAGVRVLTGSLEQVVGREAGMSPGSFDTIVSFNVLEHIPDDVGVLRLAGELVRPGGRICLFVPSQPWLYGVVDAQVGHVRRYTRASMLTALQGAGLRPVQLDYFDFLGMVPWFFLGRVLKRTTSGAGADRYDRFVVPVCRRADRLLGPPVGKNLVAVAERPP